MWALRWEPIQRTWEANSPLEMVNVDKQILGSSTAIRAATEPLWLRRMEELGLESQFMLTRLGRDLAAGRAEVQSNLIKFMFTSDRSSSVSWLCN